MTCCSIAIAAPRVRRPVARSTARPKPVPQPSAAGALTITLEAVPNLDFRPGSHRATVQVDAHDVEVGNLAEAVKTLGAFISEFELGSGNISAKCGLVKRDGVPLCQVSFNLRVWKLDEAGKGTLDPFIGGDL